MGSSEIGSHGWLPYGTTISIQLYGGSKEILNFSLTICYFFDCGFHAFFRYRVVMFLFLLIFVSNKSLGSSPVIDFDELMEHIALRDGMRDFVDIKHQTLFFEKSRV